MLYLLVVTECLGMTWIWFKFVKGEEFMFTLKFSNKNVLVEVFAENSERIIVLIWDHIKVLVGSLVGTVVGILVGWIVGGWVGTVVGNFVGTFEGIFEGVWVGSLVGLRVGNLVGLVVGISVGNCVGNVVGTFVGKSVGVAQNCCRMLTVVMVAQKSESKSNSL